MPKDTLSITDNRTGKTYELPVANGCVRAMDLRQIKTGAEDFGLMSYDQAFLNTANCRSAITFIDGDKGIVEYRGYPIEQLAEKSTFLEVAYLVMNGELPNKLQLEAFVHKVTHHTYIHENVKSFMDGFRYDSHPMSILAATIAALSGFYPDAKHVKDSSTRRQQMIRLIAKMPTIAAFSYRHSQGLPYVYPDNELSYCGNFLAMIRRITEATYKLNPRLEIAVELESIALADDYFVSRKLYPNVDFYSGLIYEAMGFPVDMFPVLFGIPRTVGWVSQWEEMITDPEQKIARPRQVFTGSKRRE